MTRCLGHTDKSNHFTNPYGLIQFVQSYCSTKRMTYDLSGITIKTMETVCKRTRTRNKHAVSDTDGIDTESQIPLLYSIYQKKSY